MHCIYCVVDMHALTTDAVRHPKELTQSIREVTAAYIAAGVDPAKHDPVQPEPGA